MAELRVLVATHKPYRMPDDGVYLPIHVGAAGKTLIEGCVSDATGDNISTRNPNFCELTGLYWAWKNLKCDFLGLAHYRRHFRGVRGIASGAELEALLGENAAILPRKRNYFIETNYSQYVHAHHAEDLELTRRILEARHPEYLPFYDAIMKRTSGHRFNMFVMRRDVADRYCTWLFEILFELERRLDISSYSTNDARVFGFVSERLLDVWIEKNGISYAEMPVLNLESQHWPTKIFNFLKRKFRCNRN